MEADSYAPNESQIEPAGSAPESPVDAPRTQVIGLDIGHSTVKITCDTPQGVRQHIFPSLACPAFQIRDEREAERAKDETLLHENV